MKVNNKNKDKIVIKTPSHITVNKSDITVPVWPYTIIGLILFVLLFIALAVSKPALTDNEIKEQIDSIENISKTTFDNIKTKYKFEERNGVSIDYSYDKDTIKVKDEYYLQDFLVNKTIELSGEELDKEVSHINNIYSLVKEEKDRAGTKALLYLVSPIPFFFLFFALLMNGSNKQNIRKLESLAEEYNQ